MDEDDYIQKFKDRVDRFLELHAGNGMTGYALGKGACNDGSFVEDLKAGREPRSSTMRKVNQFMLNYTMGRERQREGGQRRAS